MTAMMWNALTHPYIGSAPHASQHLLDMGDRRLRQDAVAEIEDERSIRECLHHRIDSTVERAAAREQCERIEIALHRHQVLHAVARKAAFDPPVEADGIDSGFGHVAREHRAR